MTSTSRKLSTCIRSLIFNSREVAAAAASNAQGSTTANPIPTKPELVQALQEAKRSEVVASTSPPSDSSWTSKLGLWAWKKDTPDQSAPLSSASASMTASAAETQKKP